MGLYSDTNMATFSKYRCKDKIKKNFIDQYAQIVIIINPVAFRCFFNHHFYNLIE